MKNERKVGLSLDHYARLYGGGKVTLARAAQEAGVSLWEMMDHVRACKIPAQYELEDFQRDLKAMKARLGRQEEGR